MKLTQHLYVFHAQPSIATSYSRLNVGANCVLELARDRKWTPNHKSRFPIDIGPFQRKDSILYRTSIYFSVVLRRG